MFEVRVAAVRSRDLGLTLARVLQREGRRLAMRRRQFGGNMSPSKQQKPDRWPRLRDPWCPTIEAIGLGLTEQFAPVDHNADLEVLFEELEAQVGGAEC